MTAGQGVATFGGMAGGAAREGTSFLSRVASTAIGVGLGSSLFELPFKAAQTYFEVSRIVAHLGARFRETGRDANYFAERLGYTAGQSAHFAEAFGQGLNNFDRGAYIAAVGAGRAFGVDPSRMVGTTAMVGRLRGNRPMSQDEMAGMLGIASRTGMDKGRLDEYLGAYQRLSEQQFRAMGRADAQGVGGAFALSSATFGTGDPRAQGNEAAGFADRFNSVLTGSGPMRTFMMRAMGYGQAGGPGYIEMRKRLEAGVFDSRNVSALFGTMQNMGLGRGGMFRALESVAGGKLSAEDIDALVTKLGTKEGLAEYQKLATGGTAADKEAFLAGLSPQERATFEKTGMEGLGARRVSAGEARAVELEAMQLSIGKPVAEAIGHLTMAAKNVMDTLAELFGDNPGELLVKIAAGVESMSAIAKTLTDETAPQRQLGWNAVTEDPWNTWKFSMGTIGSNLPGPVGTFYQGIADDAALNLYDNLGPAGSTK